jgi:hypothetical protein
LLHLQQFVKKGKILKYLILLLLIPTLSFSQLNIGGMSIEEDKMLHYIGGVAITSIAHDLIFEETKSKEKAIVYSMATTLVLSTFKEIWIDRKMDGNDIAAGMYGAITVGFTIELDDLLKRKRKKLR